MNIDPRQTDPEFQSPHAADSERASQFGMASQGDVPQPGVGGQPAAPTPAGAAGPANIMLGAEVFGSDGQRVGKVKEVYDDSFLVQKGIFFVHDYYIPYSFVAQASRERVNLTSTSDEARSQDWTERPSARMARRGEAAQPTATSGVYGPEGPGDTIQAATDRGLEDTESGTREDVASQTQPTDRPDKWDPDTERWSQP